MVWVKRMNGETVWGLHRSDLKHALIKKGEARMAVIGTRVKKFHFKVKSMLTLATVEAERLILFPKWKEWGFVAAMK